mmetsp:Transcript_33304/g.48886  ORF Transcript_33304/g.48886 Transcript_33304/m.48886 type:complete len:97 (+) Transcript_33304:169-459(+)
MGGHVYACRFFKNVSQDDYIIEMSILHARTHTHTHTKVLFMEKQPSQTLPIDLVPPKLSSYTPLHPFYLPFVQYQSPIPSISSPPPLHSYQHPQLY